MERLSCTLPAHCAGLRLDQALAQIFDGLSRTFLKGLIDAGQITVDARRPRARDSVRGGEHVELWYQPEPQVAAIAEPLSVDIVYQDTALLVVDKPAGLTVHPGAGISRGTLMNGLLHHDPQLRALPRAGIVHRLDKGTSGLMVVARTAQAYNLLVAQLQQRSVRREYQAITNGVPIAGGTVQEPIARHPRQRTRMAVAASGKPAITHYRVEQRFRAHALLSVRLETGRTHQIRVHLAHVGHPLVGDRQYGGRPRLPPASDARLTDAIRGFGRQALHACALQLVHPVAGETRRWQAPPPEDFRQLLDALGEDLRTHARGR